MNSLYFSTGYKVLAGRVVLRESLMLAQQPGEREGQFRLKAACLSVVSTSGAAEVTALLIPCSPRQHRMWPEEGVLPLLTTDYAHDN